MKRIDAVIPEKSLDAVNKSLQQAGVTGVTVYNTKGRGKITPESVNLGHWLYKPAFGENNSIMVLTTDGDADKVVKSITNSAGAGKIIITNVEELIDIRQNKKDELAL